MSTPTLPATTSVASVPQVAGLLITHLRTHGLPEPASVRLGAGHARLDKPPEILVQGHRRDLPGAARMLLAWADTLPAVTASLWRVPRGDTAQIEIAGSLIGAAGVAALAVYAGTPYDLTVLPVLEPGATRGLPLGQLRLWAALDSDGGDVA